MLALYQPEASDLRFIAMALKINNDLERVGDQAVNIAEDVIYLVEGRHIKYNLLAAPDQPNALPES